MTIGELAPIVYEKNMTINVIPKEKPLYDVTILDADGKEVCKLLTEVEIDAQIINYLKTIGILD